MNHLHTYNYVVNNWNFQEYFHEKDGYHNAPQNGSHNPRDFLRPGMWIGDGVHMIYVGGHAVTWELL